MTATATSRNVNYLPWRCTTTTWNVLISRSMEYLNVRQRFLFLFLNFDRDLWNLTPKKELCQHLANWTRWNKGDTRNKVWNAAWMQFLRACGGGGGGVHDRWSDPSSRRSDSWYIKFAQNSLWPGLCIIKVTIESHSTEGCSNCSKWV